MATRFFSFFALGFLFIQGCLAVMVEVNPRESVVLPGQNVTFMCKVDSALQYCRIVIPNLATFNLNPKVPGSRGVSYFGNGLEHGHCGAKIERVLDEYNGKVRCHLAPEVSPDELIGVMQLTVAKAPKPPELDVSRGTDSLRVYKIYDALSASCVVRDGRPVANISWFLDDQPITDGLSMETVVEDGIGNLYSKIQNLTRTLSAADNGKRLRCVAIHPALRDKNEAFRQLDVKYAPQSLPDNPVDKFGYELGKPGIISLEIDANPKPQLEWIVRNEKIREGSVDATGRIEAASLQELGHGRYKASLHIAAINKQDTETQFVLSAYNDMGSRDYSVIISTSPEPEGVELGVGSLVGIIASILILVVIVSLLCFAWKTDRWCFSGNTDDKSNTNESDTESAETPSRSRENRRRHHLLPIKFSELKANIFKRKEKSENVDGDGDAATITEELKITSDIGSVVIEPVEDKEKDAEKDGLGKDGKEGGIVYAELDLVAPTNRPLVKNADEKTEYAEIVYTPNDGSDNKKDEKK